MTSRSERWILEIDVENEAGETHGRVRDEGGRIVHSEWWCAWQDETTPARMALIAAAPETSRELESERALNAELVEALRGIATMAVGFVDDGERAIRKAEAALAKAEAREKGDG